MNRIDSVLASGQKILSPYLVAGDPEPLMTVALMHAMVEGGANILELGLPFSDPMAEGPVIQEAMARALTHGVSCHDVLNMVKIFREKDKKTPVVLMTYLNPIEQYGYERFARDASSHGVDATILVDLPPEEADEIPKLWETYNLYNIYLCSPTTSKERMSLISQMARGYLYYVSLKGVSGADALDLAGLKRQYEWMKTQSKVPLLVGFGIKTAEMAGQIAQFADGVVVGAALINQMITAYRAKQDALKAAATLIHDMRLAIDNFGTKSL